mmetsp:Transcript_12188/g.37167  ORF Transcript_12188/g.37167 Transcript_12188/m.37167 type:complete len:660 (+) Transcript_12188:107-2086(+)|eukprot:CAMPEP_0198730326 /NCGR_PEP_ID=MMETSP1475-20131203/24045_1 /TAXON_ID= ORGANISM="Unidentified sp., Strain CCMP1999" /NCGR_SAMPLE_ID=MMETSP1475 /ASSEMBLY_ACC=CAM_ASM_001111 /LENGTH=659 /DNA_ID=CAMNT_0044493117 /DNA_START=8 /DNA_END=1987 /DNA_ORIENTATION=-
MSAPVLLVVVVVLFAVTTTFAKAPEVGGSKASVFDAGGALVVPVKLHVVVLYDGEFLDSMYARHRREGPVGGGVAKDPVTIALETLLDKDRPMLCEGRQTLLNFRAKWSLQAHSVSEAQNEKWTGLVDELRRAGEKTSSKFVDIDDKEIDRALESIAADQEDGAFTLILGDFHVTGPRSSKQEFVDYCYRFLGRGTHTLGVVSSRASAAFIDIRARGCGRVVLKSQADANNAPNFALSLDFRPAIIASWSNLVVESLLIPAARTCGMKSSSAMTLTVYDIDLYDDVGQASDLSLMHYELNRLVRRFVPRQLDTNILFQRNVDNPEALFHGDITTMTRWDDLMDERHILSALYETCDNSSFERNQLMVFAIQLRKKQQLLFQSNKSTAVLGNSGVLIRNEIENDTHASPLDIDGEVQAYRRPSLRKELFDLVAQTVCHCFDLLEGPRASSVLSAATATPQDDSYAGLHYMSVLSQRTYAGQELNDALATLHRIEQRLETFLGSPSEHAEVRGLLVRFTTATNEQIENTQVADLYEMALQVKKEAIELSRSIAAIVDEAHALLRLKIGETPRVQKRIRGQQGSSAQFFGQVRVFAEAAVSAIVVISFCIMAFRISVQLKSSLQRKGERLSAFQNQAMRSNRRNSTGPQWRGNTRVRRRPAK